MRRPPKRVLRWSSLLFILVFAASHTEAAKPAKPAKPAAPSIRKAAFGTVDGKAVELYTLTNARGSVIKITTYGATLTEVHVPDRTGQLGDVVLGFDNLGDYLKKSPYFGATVGRVANRIKDATFSLDGKTYRLAANDHGNHLHGGKRGWDKVVWMATPKPTTAGPSLKLTYLSPDGDEGYPGTVHASVVYTLTNDNALRVEMEATAERSTVVSMVHHTCWNLAGSGTILDHRLTIPATAYTPGNPVPDGTVKPVQGTPFDFTVGKPIGRDIRAVGGNPIGYDDDWIVDGDPHAMRLVARLEDPKSGRVMTIQADQPALQVYSGKFLDGSNTGKGVAQVQYGCVALESQKIPNSVNVPAWRSEVILEPGRVYRHTMIHRFTTE